MSGADGPGFPGWLRPLRPVRRQEPFDDPDWVFELKYDGFRGLAYVGVAEPRLVSRNRHHFVEFAPLAREVAVTLGVERAVVDGEIACLDEEGRSRFDWLHARREAPCFCAFDLLWVDGEDLRSAPLVERKSRLRELVPEGGSRLLYVDHVEERGRALFERVTALDLEGIVAKRRQGLYREGTRWWKIKNAGYSQAEGRGELFDRRGGR